jgi:Cu-Zn family superoxide dismutase
MKKSILAFMMSVGMSSAFAGITIEMYSTENNGKERSVGTIQADDTIYGLLLTPHLHDLPPGIHGFHVHDMPFCGDHAMSAGGHLDPRHTNQHLGPYSGNGHLGDLPVLIVDASGHATLPILAPRLKENLIGNHALMIHQGGDNYSDHPEKLGGGGARIACGVIKEDP